LPLLATLVVGLSFRFVVGPALCFIAAGGTSSSTYGQPSVTLVSLTLAPTLMAVGCRLAVGTAALSFAVVCRYIGWFSIMRGSAIPLRPNPIDMTISALKQRFSSVASFLDAITVPDPTHRNTVTYNGNNSSRAPSRIYGPSSTFSTNRSHHGAVALGGRYMHPPLPIWLPQIFWHALAGAIFANVAASHLLPTHAGSEASFGLLLICSITSILTLLLTVLSDGSSHELKTQTFSESLSGTLSVWDTFVSLTVRTLATMQKANLIPYLVLLPTIITIVLFCVGDDTMATPASNDPSGGSVALLSRTYTAFVSAIISFFAAFFISTYLVLSDTLIRRALAAPGLDIDRLLLLLPRNAAADSKTAPFVAEDLIIQSVIWGCGGSGGNYCGSIVKNLAAARLGRDTGPAYSATFDLEEEEVRRNDAAIETVADSMLPSRPPPLIGAGLLEGDVLRLALLETLGGGGQSVGISDDENVLDEVQQFLGIRTRYYIALRKRLLVSEEALARKSRAIQQPLVVPLVRALCAYAGGLGEALLRSCDGQTRQRCIAPSLPPGATTCAELAILAAARLVAMNKKDAATGSGVRCRHSWISLMIPSVLHSAERLRRGVLRYAQNQMDRAGAANLEGDLGNFVAVNCPDLRRLLIVCDEAAVLVLRAVKEETGSRDIEVKVHSVCRTWLSGL